MRINTERKKINAEERAKEREEESQRLSLSKNFCIGKKLGEVIDLMEGMTLSET